MIRSGEIQKIAHDQGVRDIQIEKDYVIGWILKGMSQNIYVSDHLIFKGGTVLKKVWFADYRFSEDMDFTFQGSGWNKARIEEELAAVCEWIYAASRLKVSLRPEDGSADQYRGYLSYQGPLGGEKDIKLDISTDELLYFRALEKVVLDPYSDQEKEYTIKAYSLEESLAEKLRCVLQRTIPRDIYDIWYLIDHAGINIEDVAFGYQDKAKLKKKDPSTIVEVLHAKEKKYKASWEQSLDHQIKDLPAFDGIYRNILSEAKKLTGLLLS